MKVGGLKKGGFLHVAVLSGHNFLQTLGGEEGEGKVHGGWDRI